MTANRSNVLTKMTTRQKAMAAIFVIVVIIVVWQVIGMFRGSPAPQINPANQTTTAMRSGAPGAAQPQQQQQMTPQPAPVPAQPALTQREMELLKLQQETEAKYIAALNELQMLRVEREIAENNRAIMTAKLDAITAQKNIVDLLTNPAPQVAPGAYAQGLVGPVSSGTNVAQPGQPSPPPALQAPAEVQYTVVSVAQIQNRWSAVLGYQGNLYNVSIGDILPADGSRVVSISKAGIILEKDNQRKRVSLVPII